LLKKQKTKKSKIIYFTECFSFVESLLHIYKGKKSVVISKTKNKTRFFLKLNNLNCTLTHNIFDLQNQCFPIYYIFSNTIDKVYCLKTENKGLIYKVKGLKQEVELTMKDFEQLLYKDAFIKKSQTK
jgi:hypothetical protein